MAIRETVRSLRFYFLFFGFLGMLGGAGGVYISRGKPLQAATFLLGFAFSAVLFYAGLALRGLHREASRKITAVIYAGMAYVVVISLLFLAIGMPLFEALFGLFGGLLINWYLLRTVKRLSKEARKAPPQAS